MWTILSSLPIYWKIAGIAVIGIAFSATFGLGFWKGHSSGYESAENKYRAEIAELQADYNARALEAQKRYTEELELKSRKALEASYDYNQEKQAHAETSEYLRGRIDAYIARENESKKQAASGDKKSSVIFRTGISAESVGMLNEAIGASPGNRTTKAANSAGTPH